MSCIVEDIFNALIPKGEMSSSLSSAKELSLHRKSRMLLSMHTSLR
jgi:hypothetical protein